MSSIKQDYKAFYDYEILYRKLLKYPPLSDVLCISISSPEENYLIDVMDKTAAEVRKYLEQFGDAYECVGPAQAHIYRINNVYKKVFYIKSDKPEILSFVTEHISDWMEKCELTSDKLEVQYDINPM